MLDANHATSVITRMWNATNQQASLPEAEATFFECHGPLPVDYESDRAYSRVYYRHCAVLASEGNYYGVYTKDVSVTGIAFYSPTQIFPLDELTLIVPGPNKIRILARRCRMVEQNCFDCGVDFLDGDPGLVRENLGQRKQVSWAH